MPQTNRTANDLIVRAFYLLGEFSPDAIPSGQDVQDGLYYLNDILDYFSSQGLLIPYIKNVEFTMEVGKGEYTFSNVITNPDVNSERIVELDYVNIIRDQISYPVRIISRAELFNNARLTDLQSKPGYVILIREELQSKLKFYPVPAFPYECVVRAKYMLDHLELYDQLDEIPPYYYRFLRYALARELKDIYPSSNWSAQQEQMYQEMLRDIKANNDITMTIYPDNILMNNYGEFIYESFGIFSWTSKVLAFQL